MVFGPGVGIEPRTPQNVTRAAEAAAGADAGEASLAVPTSWFEGESKPSNLAGSIGFIRYSSAPAANAACRSLSNCRPDVTMIRVLRKVGSLRSARQTWKPLHRGINRSHRTTEGRCIFAR